MRTLPRASEVMSLGGEPQLPLYYTSMIPNYILNIGLIPVDKCSPQPSSRKLFFATDRHHYRNRNQKKQSHLQLNL